MSKNGRKSTRSVDLSILDSRCQGTRPRGIPLMVLMTGPEVPPRSRFPRSCGRLAATCAVDIGGFRRRSESRDSLKMPLKGAGAEGTHHDALPGRKLPRCRIACTMLTAAPFEQTTISELVLGSANAHAYRSCSAKIEKNRSRYLSGDARHSTPRSGRPGPE